MSQRTGALCAGINAQNQRHYVKFHYKSMQGIENFTNAEAKTLVGEDRESAQRDLYDEIEKGNFPKWRFCIQVMTGEQARKHHENMVAKGVSVDRCGCAGVEQESGELFRRR
jgi:catalase